MKRTKPEICGKPARKRLKTSTVKKPNLKQTLRTECLPELKARTAYFSHAHVREWFCQRELIISPALLSEYLSAAMRDGKVHGAGRGLYSGLAESFVPDPAPVKPLADELAKAFPLVTFSCWSTEQVNAAMHHLLSKFVTFVNVEADAMETVWEHLRDAGWDAWLNPRGNEVERFAVRQRTVVVRRELRKSPSKDSLAPIEKLLVDLYFEARDLRLMALSDFRAMLTNLAGGRRIEMASLISYAAERKLPINEMLGDRNRLIPPNPESRI